MLPKNQHVSVGSSHSGLAYFFNAKKDFGFKIILIRALVASHRADSIFHYQRVHHDRKKARQA